MTWVDRVAKRTSHAITVAKSHRAPNNMRKAWRRKMRRVFPIDEIWEKVEAMERTVKTAQTAPMTEQTE